MSDESLRGELEAAYGAVVDALKRKDFEAFAAAAHGPEGAGEGGAEEFAEAAEFLLEMTPELSQTTFVAVKAEGDDLAGYYYTLNDGTYENVFLSTFLKVEGRWRLVLGSNSYSFEPEPGEDVVAKAKALIESEASLQLQRPSEEPEQHDASEWDTEIRAALDCMAYDCEVKLAINGAPLGFEGGKSYSGMLFGVSPGAEPAAPAVLRVGENQIQVDYRKTGGEAGWPLTVEIRVLPDRQCFRLSAAKASGSVAATFHVPASEDEEVRLVEINDEEG